jgi:hypothetical protein
MANVTRKCLQNLGSDSSFVYVDALCQVCPSRADQSRDGCSLFPPDNVIAAVILYSCGTARLVQS